MLSHSTDDWAEGTLHLPIDTVIEHVKKDDSLITDENILVAQQLDKELLDQLKRLLIVVDLGDKEISLQLLNQLDLLDLPSAAKVSDKLLVLSLTKRQA